ncbi:MAG: DedA family protein [Planctomycetes bacterium]|nr:DedA family protein [Planctomycetota bacterium]
MIFPIPPDVMLVPMCVAEPKKSLRYAAFCSVASVLGGMAGYALGHFLWDEIGPWFFANVPGFSQARFDSVQALYEKWNFVVVFSAGFSPIPYKLFTISAGVFDISFPTFLLASAVSRSARFFLVAAMLKKYGVQAKDFIERRLNVLALVFVVLLVGCFWIVLA